MNTSSIFPLRLLYDGSCPVCRLELHSLKERDHADKLRLIDITAGDAADGTNRKADAALP